MFFLVLTLFLLICGGLVVLTTQNLSNSAHLVFYSWRTPDIPIALWIVLAFLLGALLLYLISIASALDDRHELRVLRKRVSELEEEKMRSLSLRSVGSPASPVPSAKPQIPTEPSVRIPTSPIVSSNLQIPARPTRTSTGPLQLSSSFIPMPGIPTPAPNSGLSAPDPRH